MFSNFRDRALRLWRPIRFSGGSHETKKTMSRTAPAKKPGASEPKRRGRCQNL